MITKVMLSKRAQRDLRRLPAHIVDRLQAWVRSVALQGLEEVRKVPGYHDEVLKGERHGQRSIRLSRHYRAIYELKNDGRIEFASVEEVNKHAY